MRLLLIGFGGALGSVLRYVMGAAVMTLWPTPLPAGTLLVNVIGCAAAGFVSLLAERTPPAVSPDAWALVVTGFLGGFTTFSAFGLETSGLLARAGGLAVANVLLHLGLGIGAVFAGRALARVILPLFASLSS